MSERKTRAIVFLVVAIIAFVCSCVLFSMTGGVSDWFINNETDSGFMEFNNTDYIDSYSLSDNTSDDSSSNSKDSSGFLDDLSKKDKKKDTYSSKSSQSSSQGGQGSQGSSQDTYSSSDAASEGLK